MKSRILYLLILTFMAISAKGQNSMELSDTLNVSVYFRQGKSVIDENFADNGRNLASFINAINRLDADTTVYVKAVDIVTSASPEGNVDFNEKLSLDRARSIKDYLLQHTALSPSQIKSSATGVAWDALEEIVGKSDSPFRDAVLDIINMEKPYAMDGNKVIDRRIPALKTLDGGKVWDRMMDGVFHELRSAGGKVNCVVAFKTPEGYNSYIAHRDTLVIVHKDTVYNITTLAPIYTATDKVKAKESRGRFKKDSLFKVPVFAFRSNLLVAPLMNIGIEVPIRNRVSLEADFYSPWAKREWVDHFIPSHKGCFQIVGGSLGCRYWFGQRHRNKGGDARYRLRGHSLGLVATGGIYDLEWDWKGQQGECVFVGIDYLYAHPVGKGGVHFEFNVGVGYGINWYNNYDVRYEGGKLIDDGGRQIRHLPVPIRLGISLAVPICKKYRNTEASEGLEK